MTRAEANLLDKLLNDLDESYSSAGCNDLFIPNTPQNREIVLAAEKAKELHIVGRTIGTSDQTILKYLRKRLKEHFRDIE